MNSITDENTNTLNTINMTNTSNTNVMSLTMRQRQHKVHSRGRSPIRPESRRRMHSKSKSNQVALALELMQEPDGTEDSCQLQMVQSCVSFGGPVVSDEEDDYEDDDTHMDVDVEVDADVETPQVQTRARTVSCDDEDLDDQTDDDVDMQVEEQDNHDVCNVINLLSFTAPSPKNHRTVSFGSVFTREYSVTVGDHPCSTDSVGLTLDWGHAAEYAVPVEQQDWAVAFGEQGQQLSSSNNNKRRIRRLSASERRKRICSVTGCLPSDVRAAEYNMALQRYNQELTEVMNSRNRLAAATDNGATEAADPQDAANESRRLLHHQQHLEVLYSCFQDVQYQQEQEYNNYVHRHRQQQQQQQSQQQLQRQHERRQLRQSRSKRAAPAPAAPHAAVL